MRERGTVLYVTQLQREGLEAALFKSLIIAERDRSASAHHPEPANC